MDLQSTSNDKRSTFKTFIDNLEAECTRLRKERDNMRELYEQANHQVLAANKLNSSMQQMMASLEARVKVFDEYAGRGEKLFALIQEVGSSLGDSRFEELSQIVAQLKLEEKMIYSELETVAKSYDEIQQQNSVLIRQLAEKDDAYGRLLAEKLKVEFSSTQVKRDADVVLQKGTLLERESLERQEASEIRDKQVQEQLSTSMSRMSKSLFDCERLKRQVADLSSTCEQYKARLEKYTDSKIEDVVAAKVREVESLKSENGRLRGESEVLHNRLRGWGKGLQKDIEDELHIYKKLMKCNSCHIRDKNAVTTKCMHAFCRQCLDTRIETRQRKCPNCGEPFGANDVRPLYL